MCSDSVRLRLACLILLAAVASACRSSGPPTVLRLAILPFENLSGDPSLDWVGPALSEGVVLGLQGHPHLRAGMFPDARDAASARAKIIIAGYYVRASGRLRLEVEQRPTVGGKVTSRHRFETSPGDAGVLKLCGDLLRWVAPDAGGLETSSAAALRALAEARRSRDLSAALQIYERGAEADPDFGGLYAAWAQTLLQHRQFAAARAVLARAQQRGERIPERRRRELAVLQARLDGDRPAVLQAMTALAAALPADTGLRIELSRELIAARRYQDGLQLLRRAVQTDPEEPMAWNDLGYAEARLGNLKAAQDALTRYRELAPREANPLDSLGDVLYHFGAFEQAAKAYQDAFHTDPAFLGGATLYKAARSKLMLGDLRAAEELFGRYAELRRRAGDALYPLAVADWLYLTGRRDAARAALNPLANRASNDLAALARARLSLWDLLEGRQEKAAAESRSLLRTPISPLANATALLVVVAAQAPGWESVPEGPFRQLGIACHLLLTNRFEEAAKILKPLVDATDPLSQDPLAVLLAWALVESGRAVDAAQLLATYGTPPAGIEPPLAPWTLPRVFALQAKTFAAQGRTQESQRADSIYRRLTSAGR